MKKSGGFTGIELLVTLTIVGILAAVATTTFSGTIERTKVRKTSDFLVQLVNTARAEALKRNKDIYLGVVGTSLCLSQNAALNPCDSANADFIRAEPITKGVTITVSPSTPAFKFDRIFGVPSVATTLTVSGSATTYTVNVNVLGIIKVSRS